MPEPNHHAGMPSGTNAMNTPRMSCGEAREKLPLYVGGDLDPEVLETVRGHLDACDECARRAVAAVRARRELVSALRENGAGRPALWPGIRAALRAEGLVNEGPKPASTPAPVRARTSRPRWTWALVPAVAAAAVLAVLQVSSLVSRGTPSERVPEIAGEEPGGDFEALPVSLPVGNPVAESAGGLRRVDPRERLLGPVRYVGPSLRGVRTAPSPNDISLTGLNGYK